ncbi:MAG: dehypoxanthine futalosine cyclase [Planctomycetaceae bacterium]|nr:dehypoxanthine futalosine cyclase [Planctomycetaceae bacterium]
MDAVAAGRARLTGAQALRLMREAPLHDLGRWASAAADRLHGQKIRTYVIDRNVNYTNVCSARCTFCAFYRKLGDDEGYVLSRDELHGKFAELSDIGGTQVLMQGGMHPELPIEFYEEMLSGLKGAFPHIHLHAFSPPEFVEFVAVFDVDGFPSTEPRKSGEMPREQWLGKLEAIMRRLQAAGLDSVPGGGAEIFAEPVRRRIGRGKASADQWLDVMRTAHRLGMSTSATMMFGHIEGAADRIDHMQRVRDAQDEAIEQGWPGRYVSFITWPFQPDHTALGRMPEWDGESGEPFPGDVLAEGGEHGDAGKVLRRAGATEYLRMQAVARLFLDNVHSIGSSWVTMGPKIGQLGLFFGANDMGSVMMEENVVSAAGTTHQLDEAMICRLIRDAGYVPAQRDNEYRHLKVHEGEGPDTAVTDWSAGRQRESAFGAGEVGAEVTVGDGAGVDGDGG